jgi:hypothetical protein
LQVATSRGTRDKVLSTKVATASLYS